MITDVYPYWDLGPILATLVVLGTSLGMIWLGVITYGRMRQRLALAAEASAMLLPDHRLRVGGLREGEILLSGVVKHADDHDVAVKIEVTQQGTENESSGSYSYRWEESNREVIVRPFYLELADGTRVRVLAPTNVEVADALDQKVLVSNTVRTLSAELIPGETLHGQGWLERGAMLEPGGETGYRDAAYEWQLVPHKGRMLLSSEPLGAGMGARARFHRGYWRWAVFAFVVCQALSLDFYRRSFGRSMAATVAATEHIVGKDSDGDATHKYTVTAVAEPVEITTTIDDDDYERLKVGDTIAIRRGLWSVEVGGGGSLYLLSALCMLTLTILIAVLYKLRRDATRPWFRRQVIHKGSGKLPGP